MIYRPEPPRPSNMPYWKKVLPVLVGFLLLSGVLGYRMYAKNARLSKMRADNYWKAQDFIDRKLPALQALPQYQEIRMKVLTDEKDETNPICGVEVRVQLRSGEWDADTIQALKQQVASGIPVNSTLYFHYVLEINLP